MAQQIDQWADMIRGYSKGIDRAVEAATREVTDPDTRRAIVLMLRETHHAHEQLLCALDRAAKEGGRQ